MTLFLRILTEPGRFMVLFPVFKENDIDPVMLSLNTFVSATFCIKASLSNASLFPFLCYLVCSCGVVHCNSCAIVFHKPFFCATSTKQQHCREHRNCFQLQLFALFIVYSFHNLYLSFFIRFLCYQDLVASLSQDVSIAEMLYLLFFYIFLLFDFLLKQLVIGIFCQCFLPILKGFLHIISHESDVSSVL